MTVSGASLSGGRTMYIVLCITVGALIGEILGIEDHIERFGRWLKIKTGNARDKQFVNGFVTASLTVCVGAMAVIGAIEDGIIPDHSILFTKAALDSLSLIGSILIFCVGVNLIWRKKLRVANLLPALVIAVALPNVPAMALIW